MPKVIGIGLLAVLIFLIASVGPIAVTGKLTAENLGRLIGREPELPDTKPKEDLSRLAARLKEDQKLLRDQEAELEQEAERIAQRERALDDTLAKVTEMQAEINAAMDQLDAEQKQAIEAIAKTLEAMNARNAAQDLEAMTPEEAARILPFIKDRNRGRILDAMDSAKRSLIHEVMQERKY